MRLLKKVLVAVVWGTLFGLFALGAGIGVQAYLVDKITKAAAITTPGSIDEERFLTIGSAKEWVTICGQDRSNPVLFRIDGGPGAASSPFMPSPLEKDFIVVEWDQPGAGKTFGANGRVVDPKLTIEQITADGIAVAEYLRAHLHKDKLILMGSSFGTIVAIEMVKQRPDLFYAYVGAAQIVNMRRGEALNYEHVLAKARAKGDTSAIKALEGIGPPPYASYREFTTQRRVATGYESGAPATSLIVRALVLAPGYSPRDVLDWFQGFLASQNHFFGDNMDGPLMAVDLPALGTDIGVPVFIFQGTEDDFAPFELAKAYFDSLTAPQKLFVAAEGAGHSASYSQASDLTEKVLMPARALALASPQP